MSSNDNGGLPSLDTLSLDPSIPFSIGGNQDSFQGSSGGSSSVEIEHGVNLIPGSAANPVPASTANPAPASPSASPSASASAPATELAGLGPHQPKNQREIDNRSIFISNLPFKVTPYKLKSLLNLGTDTIPGCGEHSVNRVTIICDRKTGLPKGFAFIELSSTDHIENALKFNSYELDGRAITVVKKRTNIPNLNNQSQNSYKNNNRDINAETSAESIGNDKHIKSHKNSNYNYIKNNKHKYKKSTNHNNQGSTNHSKLVIDDNHYLTPSSRVGVYNN